MPVVSSSQMVGPPSSTPGIFRVQPRLIGGSQPKSSRLFWRCAAHNSVRPLVLQPSGRALKKNTQCPSVVRLGELSSKGEFSVVTFCGFCHGLSRLSRCETHRSVPPAPPGRLDAKIRLKPSLDSVGC